MKKLIYAALASALLLALSACAVSLPKAVTDTKSIQVFLEEIEISDEYVPMAPKPPELDPTKEKSAEQLEVEALAAEVFRLTNIERESAGLPAFTQSVELTKTALVRAEELITTYKSDHSRPDGTSCFTAFKDNGVDYRSAGENIANGFKTPADVVKAWMGSSGHRANILSKNFGTLGVGVARGGNGKLYWVQDFTN